MTLKNIIYQNKTIYYLVIGEGRPVVLLHGFGEDSNVWRHQVDFLKDHYALIVPDIPGSGRSELIENANIDTYAEVLNDIINAELIKSPSPANGGELIATVALIGHSMGGYIALAFAEKYPQLLNSFALFHSSAFADTEEKKETRKKAIDFIQSNGVNAFLKTSTPGLFTEEFQNEHIGEVEDLIQKGDNFSKEALIQYYQAMIGRPDRTGVLKTFQKPILFLLGEFDKAVPLEAGLQQSHLPSAAHIHILEHSAHMGMWEETEKSNQILFNFLSAVL